MKTPTFTALTDQVIQLTVPLRGAITLVDYKRKPGMYQYLEFELEASTFFSQYHNDHIAIALDGNICYTESWPDPCTGRGICLGWVRNGVLGVAFELYAIGAGIAVSDTPLPQLATSNWYKVQCFVGDTTVDVNITAIADNSTIYTGSYLMPDQRPYFGESNITIRATTDFTPGVKLPCTIGFRNLTHGISTTLSF